jgi:hypothetical protein
MLKTRTNSRTKTSKAKPKARREGAAAGRGRAPTRGSRGTALRATAAGRTIAGRPKRPLRVVVMMSEEEHERLLALCDDDVRPVASWFRVVVRRAWEARKPRKGAPGVFQRQEDDGQRRRVEVWTRLSEEERDQLDILSGEEDVSVAVWYRRRLREDFASRFGRKRQATPSRPTPSPAKAPAPKAPAAPKTTRRPRGRAPAPRR